MCSFISSNHLPVVLKYLWVYFCSGPVLKLYLWDQAATDFCKKFNSCENTPTVLLVTTVNTKRLGGNYLLSLKCLLLYQWLLISTQSFLMILTLLNRNPCPILYVPHTGLHGLWCPTNQGLFHLVCIFVLSISSIQIHLMCRLTLIAVIDWRTTFYFVSGWALTQRLLTKFAQTSSRSVRHCL